MFKLILLAAVLYGVYFVFFRKPTKGPNRSIEDEDSETVVECKKCGVYISSKEVLQKDGKNYCSEECMRLT